uniref:Odorant receptor n=1 Tax=Pyrrhalta maculicollis TaxID=226885 RepID=A0A1J0KKJ4_9CUCU|nr:odorant receptor 13 [Pyrrhalta maculicollis]
MYLNFLQSFKTELAIVKSCGVWDYVFKCRYQFLYVLYFIIVNIGLAMYNLMKFNDMLQSNTLETAVAAGFVLPIALMGNIRSLCFFMNRKEFFELLTSMDDEIFRPKNTAQMVMAQKMLKYYNNFKLGMYAFSILPSFGCPIGRIIFGESGQKYCEAVITSSRGTAIYLFQAVSLGMISVINVVTNYFMVGFSLFIALQCDQLCHHLEHIDVTKNFKIKEFVQHHRRILRFAENTEKLFSFIYFSFIIMCLLAFCTTLFMISIIEDRYSFQCLHLIFYQLSIFIMLFIPCWFATQVNIKSEKIPLAAYSCAWTENPRSFKNDLIIFMNNSQKPIQFKAWNLVDLSLETYMAVIKTSFSYYTVLNSLIFEED